MAVVPGTSPPPGAVPPGTVSLPEVTKRPPRYTVAEVFFPSDEGIFAWTDSLRPELLTLPRCSYRFFD